ncbi:MAG: hypothetical protein GY793_00895 [Proteobacteria bacterium]|nr:hypothetical protein [Pseudomonadota bacterium]
MEIAKGNKKISGGGGGIVVLMIGLYLIVLAFFILLNAISESSDTKYKEANNSLKNSFGFQSGELEPTDDEVNITIEEFYSGIAKKMTGIVASYFPADNYEIASETGRIEISIPVERVFDRNETEVNPMVYSFFYDMVQMLNNLSGGLKIQIETNIEIKDHQLDRPKDDTKLKEATHRVSDIAGIIHQEKPDFDELIASVNLGKKDAVKFYIIFEIQDYQQALLSYRDYIQ